MGNAFRKGLAGGLMGLMGGAHQQWQTTQNNIAEEERAVKTERLKRALLLEEAKLAQIQGDREFEQKKTLEGIKGQYRTGGNKAQILGPGAQAGRVNPETGKWEELARNEFKPSNMGFETVNMPDGSTMQVQRDPTTGVLYKLDGSAMSPPLSRAPGRTVDSLDGPIDIAQALEAELGRPLSAEELTQVQSGSFEIPATVPQGFGQGQTPGEKQAQTTAAELAAKRDANEPKAESRLKAVAQTASNAMAVVDRAMENVGYGTAGLGGAVMGKIPGTEATNMAGDIDTLQAVLSFTELQKMRESSPTGGALGGIAVRELDLLAATIASLKQEQSPERLKENLGRIRSHLQNWKDAMQEAHERNYGAQSQAQPQPQPTGFRVIGVR